MNNSEQMQYILRTAMSHIATAEAKVLNITALHAQTTDPQADLNAGGELSRTITDLSRNMQSSLQAVRDLLLSDMEASNGI